MSAETQKFIGLEQLPTDDLGELEVAVREEIRRRALEANEGNSLLRQAWWSEAIARGKRPNAIVEVPPTECRLVEFDRAAFIALEAILKEYPEFTLNDVLLTLSSATWWALNRRLSAGLTH